MILRKLLTILFLFLASSTHAIDTSIKRSQVISTRQCEVTIRTVSDAEFENVDGSPYKGQVIEITTIYIGKATEFSFEGDAHRASLSAVGTDVSCTISQYPSTSYENKRCVRVTSIGLEKLNRNDVAGLRKAEGSFKKGVCVAAEYEKSSLKNSTERDRQRIIHGLAGQCEAQKKTCLASCPVDRYSDGSIIGPEYSCRKRCESVSCN